MHAITTAGNSPVRGFASEKQQGTLWDLKLSQQEESDIYIKRGEGRKRNKKTEKNMIIINF